jgi:hypothetical protein
MHCDNCTTEDAIHGTMHPKWLPTTGPAARLTQGTLLRARNLTDTVWECINCHAQKPRRVCNSKVTKLINSDAGLDAIIDQMIADREARTQQ